MDLWRSGIDSNMLKRLADYVNDPAAGHATDLLKYQWPELYRPLL